MEGCLIGPTASCLSWSFHVFSTLVTGAVFQFVIGHPIAVLMTTFQNWLASLQGGSKFFLGAVMGTCWGIDFGGPLTKTAASFANALNADGVFGPTAVKMAAGMAPPLGMAIAVFLQKKKFSRGDIENAKVAVPLSFCIYYRRGNPICAQRPYTCVVFHNPWFCHRRRPGNASGGGIPGGAWRYVCGTYDE